MDVNLPILLIYGPTASGKSALAVRLAQKYDAEIINADSMQVYAGLSIITACPDEAERKAASHHLFGHVDAAQRYSVGRWLNDALAAIKEVHGRGHAAILVGGTGLYFEALTKGLAAIPAIDKAARMQAQNLLEEGGVDALRAALSQIDPEAAQRILGDDRQRLLRALEVYYQTGRALSTFHKNTSAPLAADMWRGLVLCPPREALYERINRRFEHMLAQGALAEAKTMMERDLDRDLPAMKALGLLPLIGYIGGEITRDEACELAKRDSRRYAKRQYTWARGRLGDWPQSTQKNTGQHYQNALSLDLFSSR